MKIRHGFVSNSSSSSFVVITSKSNYERALAAVDEYTAAVAKAMAVEKKLSGAEIVIFSGWTDNGGESNFSNLEINYKKPEKQDDDDDEDDDMDEDGPYEAWDRFEAELMKKKSEVVEVSQDW